MAFFELLWLFVTSIFTWSIAVGFVYCLIFLYNNWSATQTTETSPCDSGQSTPMSPTPRRISIIKETEECDHHSPAGTPTHNRRIRKRDWAKKIYRSFLASDYGERSSPNEEKNDSWDSRKRKLSRRHSTSFPLQMAKDLFKKGKMRYFRQTSEANREALPRPPTEFYEPAALPEIPSNQKPEHFYILHNLKMLELPSNFQINQKDITVKEYEANQYVVQPGDEDDSMYVPLDGNLVVYIACPESKEHKEYMVKRIFPGNSFFSLLSMLDILMGSPSLFKTVSLKALEKTRVAKFSIRSFINDFQKEPELWLRPIQIICMRLLHVTMTTLHNYMGLSSELMKPRIRHEQSRQILFSQSSDDSKKRASLSQKQIRPFYLQKRQQSEIFEASLDHQKEIACKWMAEALSLCDEESLNLLSELEIQHYQEGDILIEQGSEEQQLAIVLQGTIMLKQEQIFDDDELDAEDKWAALCHAKELIGGLQVLTTEPSFYTYKAKTNVCVGVLKSEQIMKLVNIKPSVFLPIAHSVLARLSAFVRGVDFALDWVLVESGQAAYREGDIADSLFVVLSGRLRSVEKRTVIEEFGKGDVLGMIELLQKKPRSTTVLAVRFSQLARVPEGLLNFIKLTFPQVGFRLVRLLGQLYASPQRRPLIGLGSPSRFADQDPMSHIKNLHTIAILPASQKVPLAAFTCELYTAINANCRVLRLSSEKVARYLGQGVLQKPVDFRLLHWLNVQEDTYPVVIYQCDYTSTNWTRRCLRQADAILVVGMGKNKPSQQLLDEVTSLNQDGLRTNKELILLWPETTRSPKKTYEWLKGSYFSGHHHIRCPERMMQYAEEPFQTEEKIVEFYESNVFKSMVDHKSDFMRLARILTGNAIGLVLGGGGARGAAHVGIIRALRELNIPVDFVGGTSIGAMIGGIYAENSDDVLESRASSWFMNMVPLWRKIWDLTYAHTAMFTGAGFNSLLEQVFGSREIEDLWLPYFCISTDISTSEMRVHRSGCLWKYARASMSLAGYLPPICDPVDGHLLLDGGYVNNLPADIMRSLGARCVIAIDVGSAEETNLYNYGDSLSGTMVMLRKLNPWAEPQRILNMEEVQTRLAYVSCVRQLEIVKKAPYCIYLRPPIEPFKTLDFAKFDIIAEAGYKYGSAILPELLLSNENLRTAMGGLIQRSFIRQNSRKERRLDGELAQSFTDLAAAISKVPSFGRRRNSLSAMDQFNSNQIDEILEDLMFSEDSDLEYTESESEIEDPDNLNITEKAATPTSLVKHNFTP